LGAGSFYGHEIITKSPWVTQVVSIEKDPVACFYGFKHYATIPKSRIFCANVMNFPFHQNYYDCVVLIEFFEHLDKKDQDIIIERSFSALKKGGFYIATTPLAPNEREAKKVGGRRNPLNPYHLWEPTKEAFLVRHKTVFGENNVELWLLASQILTTGEKQEITMIICQKNC
ncbi:MAG: class I SAM-dependent methyltransferase, partial [Candidatus Hodarchaeota archaeon]